MTDSIRLLRDVAALVWPVNIDESQCAICLCGYEDGERLLMHTTCRIAWHEECLTTWIEEGKKTCPLCRGRIKKRRCKECTVYHDVPVGAMPTEHRWMFADVFHVPPYNEYESDREDDYINEFFGSSNNASEASDGQDNHDGQNWDPVGGTPGSPSDPDVETSDDSFGLEQLFNPVEIAADTRVQEDPELAEPSPSSQAESSASS